MLKNVCLPQNNSFDFTNWTLCCSFWQWSSSNSQNIKMGMYVSIYCWSRECLFKGVNDLVQNHAVSIHAYICIIFTKTRSFMHSVLNLAFFNKIYCVHFSMLLNILQEYCHKNYHFYHNAIHHNGFNYFSIGWFIGIFIDLHIYR